MNTKLSHKSPEALLAEIATIYPLDHGSVSVLRQGPNGPYYNHQSYEKGRHVSRYAPVAQVPELKEAIQNHHRVEELFDQFLQMRIEQSRADRRAGSKKKPPRPISSWPKTKKSSS